RSRTPPAWSAGSCPLRSSPGTTARGPPATRARSGASDAVAHLSHPAAAFGLGAALGAAPGPVQVLLLGETARGGVRRGLKAMAGANGTFGVLLAALAAGGALGRLSGWCLRAM